MAYTNSASTSAYTSFFDGLCSNIGSVKKPLLGDETMETILLGTLFTRITVKCRTLGTNTYIGIGSISQNLRFTSAGQSMTFIAPIVNGTIIPLKIADLMVIGDVSGGAGILELSGIRVHFDMINVATVVNHDI